MLSLLYPSGRVAPGSLIELRETDEEQQRLFKLLFRLARAEFTCGAQQIIQREVGQLGGGRSTRELFGELIQRGTTFPSGGLYASQEELEMLCSEQYDKVLFCQFVQANLDETVCYKLTHLRLDLTAMDIAHLYYCNDMLRAGGDGMESWRYFSARVREDPRVASNFYFRCDCGINLQKIPNRSWPPSNGNVWGAKKTTAFQEVLELRALYEFLRATFDGRYFIATYADVARLMENLSGFKSVARATQRVISSFTSKAFEEFAWEVIEFALADRALPIDVKWSKGQKVPLRLSPLTAFDLFKGIEESKFGQLELERAVGEQPALEWDPEALLEACVPQKRFVCEGCNQRDFQLLNSLINVINTECMDGAAMQAFTELVQSTGASEEGDFLTSEQLAGLKLLDEQKSLQQQLRLAKHAYFQFAACNSKISCTTSFASICDAIDNVDAFAAEMMTEWPKRTQAITMSISGLLFLTGTAQSTGRIRAELFILLLRLVRSGRIHWGKEAEPAPVPTPAPAPAEDADFEQLKVQACDIDQRLQKLEQAPAGVADERGSEAAVVQKQDAEPEESEPEVITV